MDFVPPVSPVPTAHAIICPKHGQVFLSPQEYIRQLDQPDSRWTCPVCGNDDPVQFDDSNYDEYLENNDLEG